MFKYFRYLFKELHKQASEFSSIMFRKLNVQQLFNVQLYFHKTSVPKYMWKLVDNNTYV